MGVWRRFNQFVLKLDRRPHSWEDRASLFVAHLVQRGMQSATIKSYISAIKKALVNDGYQWDDTKILLSSLTGACKLINDRVYTRLTIQIGLLELILFEIQRIFPGQNFLTIMYRALYAIAYYGLFRIGELCETVHTDHNVKAKDVHVATNKDKILIVLHSSKTHGKESFPQKIKITANVQHLPNNKFKLGKFHRNFCPFVLMKQYIQVRKGYQKPDDPFFVFSDGSAITADATRRVLKIALKRLGLDPSLYTVHSLNIGRTSDLAKFGKSITEIRRAGRWRSGAVYRYIRD